MAAASSQSSPAFTLFGLAPDAPVEDIEFLLGDVARALSRVDSKRGVLQDSRSRSRRRPAAGASAALVHDGGHLPRLPPEAVCGDLEEALVDAKELLALQGGGTA